MSTEDPRELREKEPDPRRATWNSSAVDELRALQDPGESDLVAELLEMFRGNVAPLLVRLREHAAHGDLAEAHQIAHRIKGSALNLGAERLSQAAAELERAAAGGEGAAISELASRVIDECARFLARTSGR